VVRDNKKQGRNTAYNKRFAKMADVIPLRSQYDLATSCPAGSSVRPATSQSRSSVIGKRRTARADSNSVENKVESEAQFDRLERTIKQIIKR
jgi:hypothetical protein